MGEVKHINEYKRMSVNVLGPQLFRRLNCVACARDVIWDRRLVSPDGWLEKVGVTVLGRCALAYGPGMCSGLGMCA